MKLIVILISSIVIMIWLMVYKNSIHTYLNPDPNPFTIISLSLPLTLTVTPGMTLTLTPTPTPTVKILESIHSYTSSQIVGHVPCGGHSFSQKGPWNLAREI